MFGKKWDAFWSAFETAMDKLPDAVDEAVESGATKVSITNGDISIKGNFKSLRINGRLIRLPK